MEAIGQLVSTRAVFVGLAMPKNAVAAKALPTVARSVRLKTGKGDTRSSADCSRLKGTNWLVHQELPQVL